MSSRGRVLLQVQDAVPCDGAAAAYHLLVAPVHTSMCALLDAVDGMSASVCAALRAAADQGCTSPQPVACLAGDIAVVEQRR